MSSSESKPDHNAIANEILGGLMFLAGIGYLVYLVFFTQPIQETSSFLGNAQQVFDPALAHERLVRVVASGFVMVAGAVLGCCSRQS